MWSSFVSYFTTPNQVTADAAPKEQVPESNDWVFVNNAGQEITKEAIELESKLDDDAGRPESPCLSPLPLLDITNKDSSSPEDSPSLSPSKMEDGWYVTPPPCFTADCPAQLEVSPLEDLLIEHPSMSVYFKVPEISLKVFTSKKTLMKFPPTEEMIEKRNLQILAERPPPMTKLNLSTVTRTRTYYKPYQVKEMFEYAENRRPSERAKYFKEQYKLHPSILQRQNLVRSCKNAFNSKKKCVVKPFGEKCKRSF